jgi:hypothetical protein
MIDAAQVDLVYDEALIFRSAIERRKHSMAGLRSDPRFAELARQSSPKSR